jgi:hypothetical protein
MFEFEFEFDFDSVWIVLPVFHFVPEWTAMFESLSICLGVDCYV